MSNMAVSLAEAPMFASSITFTPVIHEEHPYRNDPDRVETYEAAEIPPEVSIPLGMTLRNVMSEPVAQIHASAQALGENEALSRYAQKITHGAKRIAQTPQQLSIAQTRTLTRGEFRFGKESAHPDFPTNEVLIVSGKEARMLRDSLQDSRQGLTEVIGFADVVRNKSGISEEQKVPAQDIVNHGEQIRARLEPFITASTFLIVFEPNHPPQVIPEATELFLMPSRT